MSVKMNLLYFNRFALSDTLVNLRFHCPVCDSNPLQRVWFDRTVAVPQSSTIDFNQQVAFLIPAHDDPSTEQPCSGGGQQMQLYVAMYKDATHQLACTIATAPIPDNWWQTLEA